MPYLHEVGPLSPEALGEFGTFTPTIIATVTAPNLGTNGERHGTYMRLGPRWVRDIIRIRWRGSSQNQGSGTYQISTSHAIDLSLVEGASSTQDSTVLGSGMVRNSTSTTITVCSVFLDGDSRLRLLYTGATVSSGSPVNFASDGTIYIEVGYPIVPGTPLS